MRTQCIPFPSYGYECGYILNVAKETQHPKS